MHAIATSHVDTAEKPKHRNELRREKSLCLGPISQLINLVWIHRVSKWLAFLPGLNITVFFRTRLCTQSFIILHQIDIFTQLC